MDRVKTTVEIADGLFAQAKLVAARRKVTMRALIDEGLRKVVDEAPQPRPPFQPGEGSFRGDGMVRDFTWPELRAIIYEGRGGEYER